MSRRAGTLAATIALAFVARDSIACAPAPPPGGSVAIADESAIISWDPELNVEHFIRRATFHTTAKDFGFLVPTPTKPALTAWKDEAFDRLEHVVAPEVIEIPERYWVPGFLFVDLFLGTKSAVVESAAPVRILGEQRVAGYDATTLEADDANALADWLKEHGYDNRPALAAWLKPYVDAKWKITAFKIGDDENRSGVLGTDAIDMVFTTERPFFPYREPSDQRDDATIRAAARTRRLRVFFFGPERSEGTIGDGLKRFPGKTTYAHPFVNNEEGLLPFPIAPGTWLTAFEDESSPRPGVDDLFFAASRDPSPIKPPPEHVGTPRREVFPLELPLLAFVIGAILYKRRQRKRDAGL